MSGQAAIEQATSTAGRRPGRGAAGRLAALGAVIGAAAVGGGLQLPIAKMFTLYGDYYYSPDSLSSGIGNYKEANAGVRLTAIPLVTVSVGYRYMALDGKDGNRDNIVADGAYVGGAVNF